MSTYRLMQNYLNPTVYRKTLKKPNKSGMKQGREIT